MALVDVQEGSGGPSAGREGLRGHPSGPVGVGRPSLMSERGQEAFPEVQKVSGGPPRETGVVRRPSQRFDGPSR